MQNLKAPFPYFGGKRRVAGLVWERFGDVANYVEPFAGSLAVLLGRPHEARIETVNDRDCYLANFWRALKHDPAGVAAYADWPVNEADLAAKHLWLVRQADFRERMMTDPDYYDIKIAGWWVWGICAWIGSGWCKVRERPYRQRPVLSEAGIGIHRPSLSGSYGKKPAVGSPGHGVHRPTENDLYEYMTSLAARLRRVRVCCGDWQRVVTRSVTWEHGLTAVFLDPPYAKEAGRDPGIYAVDDLAIAHQVRAWAIENGDNPKMRIALCGYEEEHRPFMPDTWTCVAWKAGGGYGNIGSRGNQNRHRERIWFSPPCLN